MKLLISVIAAAVALTAAAAPASGEITPTRDPMALARAIADRPEEILGASFESIAPTGNPVAVSTTVLGEFPTSSTSYAILTNGDATLADDPDNAQNSGVNNGGAEIRGARDVTNLRIDLNVPASVSCLSIRFRFYSEEFPEYTDSLFNDAFIAELDQSTWDAAGTESPTIKAPRNFAGDTRGNPISVNAIGEAIVAGGLASGTTYDAASQRLRASTPITPGRHSLYLSIFDQGDRVLDSAVFIDRLTLDNLNPCAPGAAADVSRRPPVGALFLSNGRVSIPAGTVFPPARLVVEHVKFTPNPLRSRTQAVTARVRVADTRGFLVRNALVFIRGIPSGLLARAPETRTGRNGVAVFTLRPRARLAQWRENAIVMFIRARKEDDEVTGGVTGRRLVQLRLR